MVRTVKMDIFGERTLCLLSPAISSITASTFLPGSTSRGSRSRTRMGTSKERNFYTFILFSLALVILILSPSASANQRCTPDFLLLSNGKGTDLDEYGNDDIALSGKVQTHYTIREKASFKLTCLLSAFHSIKWTINGREVTPVQEDEWNIEILTQVVENGGMYTELTVNNATQIHHAGEYKCTSLCFGGSGAHTHGANTGVTVTINIAINVTIRSLPLGSSGIYRTHVSRETKVELKCDAPVANAQITWLRIKDDKRTEENMADICGIPDKELAAKMKKPPEHCKIVHKNDNEKSSTTLTINRLRKEGSETLNTLSDFRRYVCRVTKEGNQDGHAYADIIEKVTADRKYDRGARSVIVTEGEKLKIYCDIYGVDKSEFEKGETKMVWTKDGETINVDELKNIERIGEVVLDDRGKPYRVGFWYDMAERDHRGNYTGLVSRGVVPESDTVNGTQEQAYCTYYVRVKDKLGALWPFLGICGEVVILCTIILIYEKRRNKTELDESDTDGSPDQ